MPMDARNIEKLVTKAKDDIIKENMPSLSLVDEDYGQLEAIDKEDVDTYPVTFPCVLIRHFYYSW